jgi:hypothetical protein
MNMQLHGIPEEVRVGDQVETELGVGLVTRITSPVRERDQAKLEIDLGRKWLNVDQVRSIVRHPSEPHLRAEPEMHWDEHE